jgi:hypothetical protein
MTLAELEKELKATKILLEDTRKRLQASEDIEEIKKLHYSYVNSLMFAKWDEVMNYFSKNPTFDFSGPKGVKINKGRADIEKVFRESIAHTHVGKEGDVLVHPIISVDGNKGKGKWILYMMYFHPRTYQSLLWVMGIYECDYIKEDGKWKFHYLKFRPQIEPPDGPPNPQYLYHFLAK